MMQMRSCIIYLVVSLITHSSSSLIFLVSIIQENQISTSAIVVNIEPTVLYSIFQNIKN